MPSPRTSLTAFRNPSSRRLFATSAPAAATSIVPVPAAAIAPPSPDPACLVKHRRPTTAAKIRPSTASTLAHARSRSQQLSAHFSTTAAPPTNSNTTTTDTDTMAQAALPTRGAYDPSAASKFTARKIGAPNTLEHRIYVEKDGVPCSPFHDIPLYANEQQTVLNMIVEIPRWTNAKQEVRLSSPLQTSNAYITCFLRAVD